MTVELLVGVNVVDAAGYQTYRTEMAPMLEACGGGFRYDFQIAEVLKSETKAPMNRVFAIFFPDKDTMNSFFSNDEYLEVKRRHFEASVSATTVIATYER